MALLLLELQNRKIVKTLNPFNGSGSLKAERQQRRREQFKIAVWAIVVANVVLIAGLLIQGCRREPAAAQAADDGGAAAASPDTNGTTAAQQTPETNSPVTPTFESPPTNTVAETATNTAPAEVQANARDYVVVKGDSFYKIARANNLSVEALAEANAGVDSAKLKVGQVLHVPAGAEPSTLGSATKPAHAKAAASPSTSRYVVKAGDTLGRIARAHGTTVKAIKAANGLTSDRIVPGRSLKLPQARAATASSAQG